jgi:type IV secretory pathway TraG/TraD family ATPase VirD4
LSVTASSVVWLEFWRWAQGRDSLALVAAFGTLVLGSCALVGAWWRAAPARETLNRGVRIVPTQGLLRRGLRRTLRWAGRGADAVSVAGIAIPPLDETKHFKFIGTTGTGKSTAIRELLAAAIRRGDRAVIADPDGGYAARFFDRRRGDVLLNPFDRRSLKWDWCAEITHPYDVEQLVSGLVPVSQDAAGQEWRGYARTFLTALARRCHQSGWRDPAEIWRLALVATADELRPLVAGTPAQPFLDAENARMFGSIRSVTGSALAAFEYIKAQRAAPFSIREWVRRRDSSSLLFIPYKAGQIAALGSLIAAWVRLAIFEAMSGVEDQDQHLWFLVDELDALGAIDGLKDALARLRKFGGRCVLGFQSIAQVSSTYGAGNAQTIVENCGNTLILRCAGSENGGTSQFAAKLIGEREIVRRQVTRGRDRDGGFAARGSRRSKNVSDQYVTELAVLPSQLEQLPDLHGLFKRASSPAWYRVALDRSER